MSWSDKRTAEWTREFISSKFYSQLFLKWIDEYKNDLQEKHLQLIREDAPKNKFTVLSGKLEAIDDIQLQIGAWQNADKFQQDEKEG